MDYSFSRLKMRVLEFDPEERSTEHLARSLMMMQAVLTLEEVRRIIDGRLSPDYEAFFLAQRRAYQAARYELERRLAS